MFYDTQFALDLIQSIILFQTKEDIFTFFCEIKEEKKNNFEIFKYSSAINLINFLSLFVIDCCKKKSLINHATLIKSPKNIVSFFKHCIDVIVIRKTHRKYAP